MATSHGKKQVELDTSALSALSQKQRRLMKDEVGHQRVVLKHQEMNARKRDEFAFTRDQLTEDENGNWVTQDGRIFKTREDIARESGITLDAEVAENNDSSENVATETDSTPKKVATSFEARKLKALEFMANQGLMTISKLQTSLHSGYRHTKEIIDSLVEDGYISRGQDGKGWISNISSEEFENLRASLEESVSTGKSLPKHEKAEPAPEATGETTTKEAIVEDVAETDSTPEDEFAFTRDQLAEDENGNWVTQDGRIFKTREDIARESGITLDTEEVAPKAGQPRVEEVARETNENNSLSTGESLATKDTVMESSETPETPAEETPTPAVETPNPEAETPEPPVVGNPDANAEIPDAVDTAPAGGDDDKKPSEENKTEEPKPKKAEKGKPGSISGPLGLIGIVAGVLLFFASIFFPISPMIGLIVAGFGSASWLVSNAQIANNMKPFDFAAYNAMKDTQKKQKQAQKILSKQKAIDKAKAGSKKLESLKNDLAKLWEKADKEVLDYVLRDAEKKIEFIKKNRDHILAITDSKEIVAKYCKETGIEALAAQPEDEPTRLSSRGHNDSEFSAPKIEDYENQEDFLRESGVSEAEIASVRNYVENNRKNPEAESSEVDEEGKPKTKGEDKLRAAGFSEEEIEAARTVVEKSKTPHAETPEVDEEGKPKQKPESEAGAGV